MIKSLAAQIDSFGLEVSVDTCRDLVMFLDEMLRWNRKINLTAITDPKEALEKHIVDSLLLLPLLSEGESLLDMGSGAGLPGIPLQIVRPDLKIVSVDSVGKKISFQKHIKRLLGLRHFSPLNVRLEKLEDVLDAQTRFDIITARAFASLETIICLASSWLGPGGKILAMKGPEGESEVQALETSIDEAGLQVEAIQKFRLPVTGSDRQIIVLTKKQK